MEYYPAVKKESRSDCCYHTQKDRYTQQIEGQIAYDSTYLHHLQQANSDRKIREMENCLLTDTEFLFRVMKNK